MYTVYYWKYVDGIGPVYTKMAFDDFDDAKEFADSHESTVEFVLPR